MDETPTNDLASKKLSAQSLENMDSLATTISLPLQNCQEGRKPVFVDVSLLINQGELFP
ncbi:unnamed protein product [Prunus brigantina]